jgi:hypothetical protein
MPKVALSTDPGVGRRSKVASAHLVGLLAEPMQVFRLENSYPQPAFPVPQALEDSSLVGKVESEQLR